MRAQRIWIEIVLLGSAVALALALFLASIGAAAGVAEPLSPAPPSTPASAAQASAGQVFEGMVTCSRCGAKHSPALQRPATVCVRVCVHGGATFALVSPDSSYLLDGDSQDLKRLAGQRVRLVGARSGNTIKVMSVSAED
ncbi:MAG TPA: hypothetical protein VFA67_05480 [Candidatus Sulfotelmatobacter sp.]|nr:hypothetical protein [Candidatus Sulfotelmatobacter sp.]